MYRYKSAEFRILGLEIGQRDNTQHHLCVIDFIFPPNSDKLQLPIECHFHNRTSFPPLSDCSAMRPNTRPIEDWRSLASRHSGNPCCSVHRVCPHSHHQQISSIDALLLRQALPALKKASTSSSRLHREKSFRPPCVVMKGNEPEVPQTISPQRKMQQRVIF